MTIPSTHIVELSRTKGVVRYGIGDLRGECIQVGKYFWEWDVWQCDDRETRLESGSAKNLTKATAECMTTLRRLAGIEVVGAKI